MVKRKLMYLDSCQCRTLAGGGAPTLAQIASIPAPLSFLSFDFSVKTIPVLPLRTATETLALFSMVKIQDSILIVSFISRQLEQQHPSPSLRCVSAKNT